MRSYIGLAVPNVSGIFDHQTVFTGNLKPIDSSHEFGALTGIHRAKDQLYPSAIASGEKRRIHRHVGGKRGALVHKNGMRTRDSLKVTRKNYFFSGLHKRRKTKKYLHTSLKNVRSGRIR